MKNVLNAKIEVLESNKIFEQRERGITHTPYETELAFYACIRNGNAEKAELMMHELLSQTIVTGKLSGDRLRQMKYWAVCCITLATRYAIEGGLDETTAYNCSDECIMTIDSMDKEEAILIYLKKLCLDLTKQVALCREKKEYPYAVRKCLHYIHANLHNNITAAELAKNCSLSQDYLCLLFRKTLGMTIREYIKKQRLLAAKEMLRERKSVLETAYYLGFCSESYFIKCFKEEFGSTPKRYLSGL